MTVWQVYEKYQIPQILRIHMLRVAAMADIILDRWQGPEVNKRMVLRVCLFHDIGKPVTFYPEAQAPFIQNELEQEEIKKLIAKMQAAYGMDEDEVLVKICQEIGFSDEELAVIGKFHWRDLSDYMAAQHYEAIIGIYADMRVSPTGLVSLEERVMDWNQRTGRKDYEAILVIGREAEAVVTRYSPGVVTVVENDLQPAIMRLRESILDDV